MRDSPINNKRCLVSLDAVMPVSKRKRVSFAANPSSVHGSDRDFATCLESWLTKETIMDTVRAHPATVQQAQASDPTTFNLHCELLASAYTNSVVEGDGADSSHVPSSSFSCSHLLGMSNSLQLRGLEAFVLSSVASDRMQRRRRHQSTMLKAQDRLNKNSQDERASLMRQLSERLTASSKSFALAMARADTVAAMMEHASSRALSNGSKSLSGAAASTTRQPQHTQRALTTSLPVEPTSKRRCMPCKIVSPMA